MQYLAPITIEPNSWDATMPATFRENSVFSCIYAHFTLAFQGFGGVSELFYSENLLLTFPVM